MANFKKRYPDNVAGRFFVDTDCIYCGLCSTIAPDNFRLSDQKDHDIVYKQPDSKAEFVKCQEALEICPVEAIGDFGDDYDDGLKKVD